MNKGVIDIGNSRVKAAIFSPDTQLLNMQVFSEPLSAQQWLKQEQVVSVMSASVGQSAIEVIEGLKVETLTHQSLLPFRNLYKSPETLGVDRIAVMAAAAVLYPGKPVLVFDIGTCITIDLLEPGNIYRGGNISPGINMRLKAMHQMTGRLPLADKSEALSELGNTTHTAIASGVITGIRHEIEGYQKQFSETYPELISILCGGDHSHFVIPSKYRIFAAPNFVLQGLYHLLLLNEK